MSASTNNIDNNKLQIYSLYIINKAGGLIYQKDFSSIPKLNANDYLRMASTFHSLHAITARGIHIAPVIEKNALKVQQLSNGAEALPRSQEGILSLEAKDFRLQCLQTLTGIKFLLLASVQYNSVLLEKMLNSIYAVYADYVLKNPFYELEMPIRVELFDTHLAKIITPVETRK